MSGNEKVLCANCGKFYDIWLDRCPKCHSEDVHPEDVEEDKK